MDKIKIKTRNQKFCSLCSRVIRKNEECFTFSHQDNRGKNHFGMFVIHLDCVDHKDDMHNLFFRENVKNRSSRPKSGAVGRGKAPRPNLNENKNVKDKNR